MATKSVLSDQQRRARDLEIGKGHAITNAWAHYEGWALAYELAACGEKLSAARIAFICDALGVNTPEAGDESEVARDYISDSALSVEVRSGWQLANNGQGELTQAEFRICFTTGGPSLYLQGWIDEYDQPRSPEIAWADWGDSGELFIDRQGEPLSDEVLAWVADCFYFGG